jgi:hypothetical protein
VVLESLRDMTDQNDEKWDAYPETVLEFTDPRARIDLRRPISDADRRELARRGLDRPFAVITAENPCGLNAEDAASEKQAEIREQRNRKRMADFVAILEREGIRFQPVDGASPDGTYREHSLAVLIDRDGAIRLARQLDQLAIFWFDGTDFWLVAAELSRRPEKLPRTSERIQQPA